MTDDTAFFTTHKWLIPTAAITGLLLVILLGLLYNVTRVTVISFIISFTLCAVKDDENIFWGTASGKCLRAGRVD